MRFVPGNRYRRSILSPDDQDRVDSPYPGSHSRLVVRAGRARTLATLSVSVAWHVEHDVRHGRRVDRSWLILRPTGLRLVRMGGGRGRGLVYGGNRGEYTSTAYLVTLGVAAPAAGLQQAAPGGSAVRGGGQGRWRARSLRGTVERHLHLHEFAVLEKQ